MTPPVKPAGCAAASHQRVQQAPETKAAAKPPLHSNGVINSGINGHQVSSGRTKAVPLRSVAAAAATAMHGSPLVQQRQAGIDQYNKSLESAGSPGRAEAAQRHDTPAELGPAERAETLQSPATPQKQGQASNGNALREPPPRPWWLLGLSKRTATA